MLDFSSVNLVGGNVLIDGDSGNDTILGSVQADRLRGGRDADVIDGREGSDTYEVTGAGPDWVSGVPYTFEGYDSYSDTGAASDNDRLVATGTGAVDIGLRGFSAASGIEQIVNGTSGGSLVRLLGNWEANTLDFSSVNLVGGNVLIDGGSGNDTILGSVQADRLRGGHDTDVLTGGGGADTFDYSRLSDALWNGWSSFERISDFVVGEDQLDVNTIPAAIQTLGSVTALSTSAIGSLLNSARFGANTVTTFQYSNAGTTRTFLAFNDATAGFNSCTDALVEISGFSYGAGTSSLNQITLV
jgi:Ca2+-binding RTX toxin-like protein